MKGLTLALLAAVGMFSSWNTVAAEGKGTVDYHKKWYTASTASTFNDEVRRSKTIVEVFYDREGGLYPSSSVSIDTNRLMRGFDIPDDAGTVRGYFAREAANPGFTMSALARDAGLPQGSLPSGKWSEANWQSLQAGYRKQIANRIVGAAHGSVVFVVHGFRNDYDDAREWYEPLDQMVLAQDPNATLVHVYWDGLVGWRFLNLWKKAQYNMADIGLEFRRLLNELPEDMPIRIITHSTGSPLIANALGDASAAFRQKGKPIRSGDCYYARAEGRDCVTEDQGSYAIKPKSHLRFGAIAPAASLNTFDRYRHGRDIYPERISMALNRRDSATGKYLMNCELYGSSCMAVKPATTCNVLTEKFSGNGTNLGVFDFNLSTVKTPKTFGLWREHSVKGYAKNERWTSFLQHLLTDAATASDVNALCDPGAVASEVAGI